MLSHVSYSIHVFICVFMHVKLGSAELSASEKVGDETTNLFSPLEKFQRGIHWVLLLVVENAEHVAFIKRRFFGRRLSGQRSTRGNLALIICALKSILSVNVNSGFLFNTLIYLCLRVWVFVLTLCLLFLPVYQYCVYSV